MCQTETYGREGSFKLIVYGKKYSHGYRGLVGSGPWDHRVGTNTELSRNCTRSKVTEEMSSKF